MNHSKLAIGIGIGVRKGNRAPVVDNFRSLALEKLRHARSVLFFCLPLGVDLEITGSAEVKPLIWAELLPDQSGSPGVLSL
jgi:hypothetical protein